MPPFFFQRTFDRKSATSPCVTAIYGLQGGPRSRRTRQSPWAISELSGGRVAKVVDRELTGRPRKTHSTIGGLPMLLRGLTFPVQLPECHEVLVRAPAKIWSLSCKATLL